MNKHSNTIHNANQLEVQAKLTEYVNEILILISEGLSKNDAFHELSCTYLFSEIEEDLILAELDKYIASHTYLIH